jgi:hypothetical protein
MIVSPDIFSEIQEKFLFGYSTFKCGFSFKKSQNPSSLIHPDKVSWISTSPVPWMGSRPLSGYADTMEYPSFSSLYTLMRSPPGG